MMHEVWLFCLGVGAGLALAAFFDLGRALRKRIPHSTAAVALEDFLFWMVTAGVMFFLFEHFNKGVLRFYVFLGCAMGSLLYGFVFTRVLFPIFFTVIRGITWVFRLLHRILGKGQKISKKMLTLPLKNLWERIKIVYNNL